MRLGAQLSEESGGRWIRDRESWGEVDLDGDGDGCVGDDKCVEDDSHREICGNYGDEDAETPGALVCWYRRCLLGCARGWILSGEDLDEQPELNGSFRWDLRLSLLQRESSGYPRGGLLLLQEQRIRELSR